MSAACGVGAARQETCASETQDQPHWSQKALQLLQFEPKPRMERYSFIVSPMQTHTHTHTHIAGQEHSV